MRIGDRITDNVERVWQLTDILNDNGQRLVPEDFLCIPGWCAVGDFAKFALCPAPDGRALFWAHGEHPKHFPPGGHLEFRRIQ